MSSDGKTEFVNRSGPSLTGNIFPKSGNIIPRDPEHKSNIDAAEAAGIRS